MRQQRVVRVDPRTGKTIETTWIAPDATTLEQRAAELERFASCPYGPGCIDPACEVDGCVYREANAQGTFWLDCDGCGWRTTLSDNRTMPPGWINTDRGDLCPACATRAV